MNILRFLVSIIFISSLNSYFHKEKIVKSILISFVTFLLMAISETIVMLFLVLNKIENIAENYYGMLWVNIAVSLIALIIIKTPYVIKRIRSELDSIPNNIGSRFYLIFLIVFSNFALLIHYIYFEGSKATQIMLYIISIILIVLLFINTIKNKSERIYIISLCFMLLCHLFFNRVNSFSVK